jgi:hypothetical protein
MIKRKLEAREGMPSKCNRRDHKTILKMIVHVRFDVWTAVTMKNAVFWDIETEFVLHRKHITSPL